MVSPFLLLVHILAHNVHHFVHNGFQLAYAHGFVIYVKIRINLSCVIPLPCHLLRQRLIHGVKL